MFRPEWQTDFHHFIVNHMIVGFVLLATNLLVHKLFGWAAKDGIRGWVQDLPFLVALFLIVLVADLVQYWTHRAYHEVPLLWRLHAVHHSVKSMDWLAGSRQHILELHHHAHAGARADLRARLQQGSDRRLHRHRRLPGGVQPRQRERAARAAALRDRDAQLPPLAPLAGRRGASTATTRRTSRSSTTRSAPPYKADRAVARTATAWSATTCRTASSSSSRFRSSGRAEGRCAGCEFDVVIVGAGAAGLHCAAIAGQRGCSVLLIDHAEKVAEKIRISGGGRCNFTNRDVGAGELPLRQPRLLPLGAGALHAARLHRPGASATASPGTRSTRASCSATTSSDDDHRHAAAPSARPAACTRWQPCRGGRGPRTATPASSSTPTAAPCARRSWSSPPAASRSRRSAPATSATASRASSATAIVETAPGAGAADLRRGARWAPFAALAGAVAAGRGVETGSGKAAPSSVEDLLFTHRGLSGPAMLQISSYWRPGEPLRIDLAPGHRPRRPRCCAAKQRVAPQARPTNSPSCCRAASPTPGSPHARPRPTPAARAARPRPGRPRRRACSAGSCTPDRHRGLPQGRGHGRRRRHPRARARRRCESRRVPGPVLHRRGGRRDRLARRLQLPVGLGQRRRLRPGAGQCVAAAGRGGL